ncbi:BA14K family protein [Rhodoligotrophos defluvii]|uniref:BA14K family protein n=1 Tax=Rhodoligotrophos defluvii TaxID=2561934 RepID=UPI0010C948DF|nr:BA14K family protein [Rhodoligotrophos defluvii]
MLKSTWLAISLAAAMAGGLPATEANASVATASALTRDMGAIEPKASADLRLVQFYYDPYRFGPRYLYPRPGYRYRYGGYYYRVPWWERPPVVIPAPPPPVYYGRPVPPPPPVYGVGNAHVRWCLNRYRSYDPGSNTFVGYDGRRRPCVSPY